MKKRYFYKAIIAASMLAGTVLWTPVQAGIYSDDLTRCLVESSTEKDKLVLVRWMFTAMAQHPAVKPIASVSPAQSEKMSKEAARLFEQLVTEKCVDQAGKAIKYEGPAALQSSFSVFGQVAAGELFANPAVAASLAQVQQNMNVEKIQRALGLPLTK